MTTTQQTPDSILIKILMQIYAYEKAIEKFPDGLKDDLCYAHDIQWELLDVVLDAIGVPADNVEETNAIEIANNTGIWPEGSYSRDFYHDEWFEITHRDSDEEAIKAVISFPQYVRDSLAEQNRDIQGNISN